MNLEFERVFRRFSDTAIVDLAGFPKIFRHRNGMIQMGLKGLGTSRKYQESDAVA